MDKIEQVGGNHYANEIQVWDITAHYNMNFFLGNILKYVCRYDKKNGVEDLQKALSYLDRFEQIPQVDYMKQRSTTIKEDITTLVSFQMGIGDKFRQQYEDCFISTVIGYILSLSMHYNNNCPTNFDLYLTRIREIINDKITYLNCFRYEIVQ